MKLKFISNLDYQKNAIDSIVNIFKDITKKGKNNCNQISNQLNLYNIHNSIWNTNPMIDSEWWKNIGINNIKNIQEKNKLNQIQFFPNNNIKTFDIEMETGTGKTYIYLRTILELHTKYGFSKFIILVPGNAVKEGVLKTLSITKDHFNVLYNNVPYNWSNYDSKNLDILNDFAENNNLEIMIMNIQQINKYNEENSKQSNNIYKETDQLNGRRPIEIIQNTNPIILIDEPQTTASGLKSIKSIEKLNPLFIIRYSATFKKRNDEILMYQLNAIDAYKQNLVKHISVYGIESNSSFSKQIKILNFDNERMQAEVEIVYLKKNKGFETKKVKLKESNNLQIISNNNEYKDFIVEEINFEEQYILFSNGKKIFSNYNNLDLENEFKRCQIRQTIQIHLDKQVKLEKRGIKVLSLFFIDKVSNYRIYKNDKTKDLGIYAKYFEEELRNILESNYHKYKSILNSHSIDDYIEKCHDGYFSIDKNNNYVNSSKTGDSQNDEKTYNKIMKDKERLLSLDEPLSFIFSHTALKEGWDNPNVFQICTLNETNSEMKKRQEIGRGLRICVDQSGERVHDENINELSIIPNESYEKFVNDLQNEMIDDGIDLATIKWDSFISETISNEKSQQIFNLLSKSHYLNDNNQIIKFDEEEIKILLTNNISSITNNEIDYIVEKLTSNNIKKIISNGNKLIENKIHLDVINSKEFKTLWTKINSKTMYKFKFDSDKFIDIVSNKFKKDEISNLQFIMTKNKINMDETKGVTIQSSGIDSIFNINISEKIDLIATIKEISKITNLKCSTIVKLLQNNEILESIIKNKSVAINKLVNIIKNEKIKLIVEGIEYNKINKYYELSQLETNYDFSYDYQIEKNLYKVENKNKYPYKYLKCDSNIEKDFAIETDKSDIVNKYIKLPNWFKIKTPLGNYNPDWVILINDTIQVAETKGSNNENDLRNNEQLKIQCGKKHFESLNLKNSYSKVKTFKELIENIIKD